MVYLRVGEGHAGLQGDLVIIVGKAIFRVVCSINPLPEISGELDQFVDLLRVTLRSSGSGVYVASSNVNLQFDLELENDCLDVLCKVISAGKQRTPLFLKKGSKKCILFRRNLPIVYIVT